MNESFQKKKLWKIFQKVDRDKTCRLIVYDFWKLREWWLILSLKTHHNEKILF